jgi:hypothetical protein
VYIPRNFRYTAALFPKQHAGGALGFKRATSRKGAHIVVQSDGDGIVVKSCTSKFKKRFALAILARLPAAINSIAHFNYFLEYHNGSNAENWLQFELKMHRLIGEFPVRSVDLDFGNMVKDGKIEFVSDEKAKYGFLIHNTSPNDLFPYLFYFDPEDYTIQVSSAIVTNINRVLIFVR